MTQTPPLPPQVDPATPLLSRRSRMVVGAIAAVVALSAVDLVVVASRFGASAQTTASGSTAEAAPRVAVLSARRAPELITDLNSRAELQTKVDQLLAPAHVGAEGSAASCLLVRERGRTIVVHNSDLDVLPASTMKVLTATAVLAIVKPTDTFTTTVRAAAPVIAGVVQGDLWLVGGGDPILATKAYLATFRRQPQIATSFEQLADNVAAAGVTHVVGAVVADERLYDVQRGVPTWKDSYQSSGEVGQLSAMAVNDGFFQADGKGIWRISTQPALAAGDLLATLLRERGILVDGATRVAAVTDPVATVVAPVDVARVQSPPMVQVLNEMLSESDNTTAELMVKHLGLAVGGEGSTAAGVVAMRAALSKAGLPIDRLVFSDGSGLDRSDRVTCALLATAVELAPPELINGLPVGGESGTLARRMRADNLRGRIKAKTGTLNGVSALAGVAEANGTQLQFALVLNKLGPTTPGRAVGDELAALLVAYPNGPNAKDLAP